MGYLIEYESHEQEEVLLSYLREKYEDEFSFWIGLHDQTSENAFVWEHSKNQVNIDISFFLHVHPTTTINFEDLLLGESHFRKAWQNWVSPFPQLFY